ncbi:MAG: hypothetical protein AAF657_33285, partial [Acidobacteriota bacterium]
MSIAVLPRQRSSLRILVLLLSCSPMPLQAEGEAPTDGRKPPGAITAMTSPKLRPAQILERFGGDHQRATRNPALARFLAVYGTDWEIRWDQRSDRPHLLQGPGVPLLPPARAVDPQRTEGAAMAPHATLQQVETLARRFLEEVADLLR